MAYLIAEAAQPIEWIKVKLKIDNTSLATNKIQHFFQLLVNCSMCVSFWLGLIYYNEILLACLLSVSACIFSIIMNKINQ